MRETKVIRILESFAQSKNLGANVCTADQSEYSFKPTSAVTIEQSGKEVLAVAFTNEKFQIDMLDEGKDSQALANEIKSQLRKAGIMEVRS